VLHILEQLFSMYYIDHYQVKYWNAGENSNRITTYNTKTHTNLHVVTNERLISQFHNLCTLKSDDRLTRRGSQQGS